MNEIKIIGRLDIPNWHDQANRIYDTSGICPTVHTQSNNLVLKVLVKRYEQNNKIRQSLP